MRTSVCLITVCRIIILMLSVSGMCYLQLQGYGICFRRILRNEPNLFTLKMEANFSQTSQHISYNPEGIAWATAAAKTCKRSWIFLLPSTKSPSLCLQRESRKRLRSAVTWLQLSRRVLTPPLLRLQTHAYNLPTFDVSLGSQTYLLLKVETLWNKSHYTFFKPAYRIRLAILIPDLFDPEDGKTHCSEAIISSD